MPDRRTDLRATEDSIIGDAGLLKRLESEKAELEPGDPRVDVLSEHVERVADAITAKAAIQRRLAAEIGPER
jgi:hypothetical protein